MSSPATPLDADACYRAVVAHDARFDGAFFIGVTSTGIYCRPVCRVKTPRRENCRYSILTCTTRSISVTRPFVTAGVEWIRTTRSSTPIFCFKAVWTAE